MALGLVVGIFPGSEPSAIQSALAPQQIDLTKVTIVVRRAGGGDAETPHPESEFVDVTDVLESNSLSEEVTRGTGIIADSGGTSVPGIGKRDPMVRILAHARRRNYLGGLQIPADEADNFNTAIDEGRAVVAYHDAGAESESIAKAFTNAGLRNVRVY